MTRAPPTAAYRIDAAIRGEVLGENKTIAKVVGQAKDFGGRLHLIGLVSDGGVHASLHHLHALIDVAQKARLRVIVHALLDGVDVPPGTAPRHIADLEQKLAGGVGRIGTVSGRSWAMADSNRWDRVQACYRAILAAEVFRADTALQGIERSHEAGNTDDSVEPFVVFDYPGVSPVDVAIHTHFRSDGTLELTRALASARFDAFARKGGRAPFAGRYACLSAIDGCSDVPSAYPSD